MANIGWHHHHTLLPLIMGSPVSPCGVIGSRRWYMHIWNKLAMVHHQVLWLLIPSTVQVGISHHMHGSINIEFLAKLLNSRQESGKNTLILQFLAFWVLVSISGVIFHLSTHLKQMKLRFNHPFIVSQLLREVLHISICLDNTISRKKLNICQATFSNKKYMLH